MRLPKGIVVDAKGTFGVLKFSSLRRERRKEGEDGQATGDVIGRTYDLKSSVQGEMIQVTLPADVSVKEFDYNEVVSLVDPEVGSVADRGSVNIFVKAQDMVSMGKSGVNRVSQQHQPSNNQAGQQQQQQGKQSSASQQQTNSSAEKAEK